ncbi:MAG: DUF937 domain-containing protein [Lautropia sp.]|nr:DUF937 domain-containing protein [Lautropia sp.]
MSPTLTQQLLSQLQGAPMQQIAQQLGTNTEQASSAVSQALPLLMGALGNQASQPQGIQNLLGSLGGGQGAGGLGGMLGSLLGGGASATGGGLAGALGGMLGNVLGGGTSSGAGQAGAGGLPGGANGAEALLGSLFGGQQARAEEGLGKASGLGSHGAHNLMLMLAPIVISFLGQRFLQGSGSSSPQGEQALNQALANEQQELKTQAGGNLLGNLLDQNGDGKLDMHDLVKLGSSLLGGKR